MKPSGGLRSTQGWRMRRGVLIVAAVVVVMLVGLTGVLVVANRMGIINWRSGSSRLNAVAADVQVPPDLGSPEVSSGDDGFSFRIEHYCTASDPAAAVAELVIAWTSQGVVFEAVTAGRVHVEGEGEGFTLVIDASTSYPTSCSSAEPNLVDVAMYI